MPDQKISGTYKYRVVTIHDQFVCKSKPEVVGEKKNGQVVNLEGCCQVTIAGWHTTEMNVTLPASIVRFIQRGEYRFGTRLAAVPALRT